MTFWIIIALAAFIVVLTVLSIYGVIPAMRIVPDDTKFDFIRFRRISFPISAVLSIFAIALYFTHGLNFGIDFRGGTLLEIQQKSGPADIASAAHHAQRPGAGRRAAAIVRRAVRCTDPHWPAARWRCRAAGSDCRKCAGALGDAVEYRRVEVVGPRVSGELLAYGVGGLMLAIVGILMYLWFRFEWQFALGAMIANVHDIVLTIGFMSIAQIDFDLTSIAALLTILGYSLNDTVVIYDRIREMLRRYKKMSMPELLNVSINSTLSRSIITHVTVTLALLALLLVRRQGDPQLHRDDDVRRGAGRHLHLDLHRGADSDLSRRRHQSTRRGGQAGQAGKAVTADGERARHLPHAAPIDAYGNGGFRFADMSHRGSLLCLPDGVWAWPVEHANRSTMHALALVFAKASELDTLIIGTGREMAPFPSALRRRSQVRQHRGRCDADRSRDSRLQHHDRRAPPRRRRPDRGAMSADAHLSPTPPIARASFAAPTSNATQRHCSLHRNTDAGCWRCLRFNIEIARIREQISQPLAGEIRLQWWSDLLAGLAHGEAAGNPVAAELLLAIARHALPRELLERMIEAHRFDLYDEPMQAMTDLEGYLRDTASTLFALGARVLGGDLPADALLMRHAGFAFGLTRIVEAMPAHASRGQSLPAAGRTQPGRGHR